MALTPLEDELQATLGTALLSKDVQVFPRHRADKEKKKYVIFIVTAQGATEYANDVPIFGNTSVDVDYFSPSELYNETDIEVVIESMKNIGFILTSELTPNDVDEINLEGTNMEFSREWAV